METKHWIMLLGGGAAIAIGYWWWKNHQTQSVPASALASQAANAGSSPNLPPPPIAPPMSVPSDQTPQVPTTPWIDPITAAANQARADKAAQERLAQATSFAAPAFRFPGT